MKSGIVRRTRPAPEEAELARLILTEPVLHSDDGLYLSLGEQVMPLLMQGEIVRAFLPGWKARLLYTGFAPLFLLELVHADGREATWYLDCRMQRIADTVDRLGPELAGLLRQKATPVLERLLGSVLADRAPRLDESSAAFLLLCEATRRAIGLACREAVLPQPRLMLADALPASRLITRDPASGALHAIDPVTLAAGFATEWQDRLPDAFRCGTLGWPSPIDGATLHAQGSLCLDDFHFAYRFCDERHGLVFFVLIADHCSTAGAIWFPCLGLLIAGPEERTRGIASIQLYQAGLTLTLGVIPTGPEI